MEIITRNLLAASRQGRLIVRHLLLPGHVECCLKPIVNWLHKHLPRVEFSLRTSYLPSWRAQQFVELRTPVSRCEGALARAVVSGRGLCVIQ
jgi:putative pyruvate formate lyase activating enzyme